MVTFYLNDQEIEVSNVITNVEINEGEKHGYKPFEFMNKEVTITLDQCESNLRVMSDKMRSMFKVIHCDGKIYL